MERVMSELIWYFNNKVNLEVHLVLYGITREIFYSLPDSIIIHKPTFTFKNQLRFYYSIRTMFFVRKAVKSIKPKSILSFGEYWNSFCILALLGLSYPIYVSDRSQPDKSLGKFHDSLRHCLYPKAKGLILQTIKARDIYLSANNHSNIAIIGNPIRQLNNTNSITRQKIVVMVGRLIKSKNQDLLIEIFSHLNKPDWRLMIVGYDHMKQENMQRLKDLAIKLNVDKQVIFTGKHDNMEEIYFGSSIFAFTSSSEGFPNVIGEAMSASLPVVAFDCMAGPAEMISDGVNGYLVPLFDTNTFQEKLLNLMNDEGLRIRMGNNAKKSIMRFSSEIICESFFRFITA